jgi:hypothetical protein
MSETTADARHIGASHTPRRRLHLQWPVVRVGPGERVVRLAAGETVLRDGELGHLEDVVIRAVYAGLTGDDGPEGGHRAPGTTLRAVAGGRGIGAR